VKLQLSYPDKYRLWAALVRGNADRLFIATDEKPQLGDEVKVEIKVEDLNLIFIVTGAVIGRRGLSRRFEAGVYLRISESSLREGQRLLGMECLDGLDRRARRTRRVRCKVPVRFLDPDADEAGLTRNVSRTGVFAICPVELAPDQRVVIELQLEDGPLVIAADVVWSETEGRAAGMEIAKLSESEDERLSTFIQQTHEAIEAGRLEAPKPILVADDDEQILQMMSMALTKHGFEVYRARSGQETMELLRQLDPRLMVVDILMPGIDGAEICKIMRGDAEWIDIPIIFVSALEENILHQVASESGATDYLTKPFALGDLLNLVGEYLKD